MAITEKIIVLIGLMGAGKSRVGAELAKLLEMEFVDVDKEIEQAAGYSIAEIFEKFGEAEFRRGEKRVMQRLLSGSPKVMATGGGAFIQPDIRSLIKDKAVSVWLNANIDTLVERTSRTSHRPLLKGKNARVILQKLMDERYAIYAEADITVTSDKQSARDMAWALKQALGVYFNK